MSDFERIDEVEIRHNGKIIINGKMPSFRAREIMQFTARQIRKYSGLYRHHVIANKSKI